MEGEWFISLLIGACARVIGILRVARARDRMEVMSMNISGDGKEG